MKPCCQLRAILKLDGTSQILSFVCILIFYHAAKPGMEREEKVGWIQKKKKEQ